MNYIDLMKMIEKSSLFSKTHEDHADLHIIIEFYNHNDFERVRHVLRKPPITINSTFFA